MRERDVQGRHVRESDVRGKSGLRAILRSSPKGGLRLPAMGLGRAVLLWLTTAWLAAGMACPVHGQTPKATLSPATDAGVAPPERTSTPYWSRDVVLRNVEAERVIAQLEALGIEVPVGLEGTVSLAATVWIPYRDLLTPTKYRLEATLTSPQLTIDAVRLADAALQFRYEQGRLTLSDLRGTLLDDRGAAAGKLAGTGVAQLIPLEGVTLELGVEAIDLRTLARDLTELSALPRGLFSGQVRLVQPDLRTVASLKGWTADGALDVAGFAIESEPFWDLEIETLRYRNGLLRVDGVTARQRPTDPRNLAGTIEGSGSAQLFPAGRLAVDLRAQQIDLAEGLPDRLMPKAVVAAGLGGVASGRMQASHPQLDRLDDWRAWRGQASLRVEALTADQRPPVDLDLPQVRLSPDGLSLAEGTLSGLDWQMTLEGNYDSADPQAFRLAATTTRMPIAWLYAWVSGQAVPAASDGTLAFDLTASGEAALRSWEIDGQVTVDEGRLAGLQFDDIDHGFHVNATRFVLQPRESQAGSSTEPERRASLRLGSVEAAYHTSPETFHIDRFQAELLGGSVKGKASLALQATEAATEDTEPGETPATVGRHRATIAWTDLGFAWNLAAAGGRRLQGISQGEVDWSAAASSLADPRTHELDARIELSRLALAGTLLGDLTVGLKNRGSVWQGALSGQLWDGQLQGMVTAEQAAAADWSALPTVPLEGNLQVDGADVRRLFALWQPPPQAEKWRGQARLDWNFRARGEAPLPGQENVSAGAGVDTAAPVRVTAGAESDAAGRWSSEGEIGVSNLTYGGRPVSRQLSLQVNQVGDVLTVQQFVGEFAGGRLGASGSWRMSGASPGVTFLLTGVDVNRAALLVSPNFAAQWKGIASGRIQIAGERLLRGSGRLEVRQFGIHGLQLGTMRAGIDGQFDRTTQQWRVRFRDIVGSVARGRMRGSASLRASTGQSERFDLESRWELAGVDFEEVLGDLQAGGSRLGRGKLTGTLDLGGQRIRAVDDLEGQLTGRLGGTEASAVPGLPAVQNQLGVLSLRNTRFESGTIDATLRRGIFRINALGLASDQLRVWADGQIAMATGRADLNAVLATGDFEQANVTLVTLAQQFAVDATLPVSAIVRINEALSNRVIFLRLTGTLAHPRVRVRAGETLARNAATFFLRSLTDGLVAVARDEELP